jgi:hypothetical protein
MGFRIREGWDLQFRGELFNTFNHPNLRVNGGQTDVSGFNFVPASKFGTRSVQLALKLPSTHPTGDPKSNSVSS